MDSGTTETLIPRMTDEITREVVDSLALRASAVLGFGFGGASVTSLDRLHEVSSPGDLAFFGLDTELNRKYGEPNPGAAAFFRRQTACMAPWTDAHGSRCFDVGLLASDNPQDAIRDAFQVQQRLSGLGLRPILVGCDHTASILGVLGLAHPEPITYLVFDAHLDLGLHHETADVHNGNFVHFLRQSEPIARVVNVGARSWTSCSPIYQALEHVTCIPGGVRQERPETIIERLAFLREGPVYVSLDADVLDPSCAPNVSCPEPFGMRSEELFALCEWIGDSCTVIGADVCELLPDRRSLGSEQVLLRCVHALFPRADRRRRAPC